MTAHLTVTYCATCGALETAHEIRANGTRGRRYAMTAGSTDSVACPGWMPGRVEERPDEGELRRRLAAVLEIHVDEPGVDPLDTGLCAGCLHLEPWPCPTVRAARGET